MKKFYIADWHYGHNNCLHFDNRPFKTVEEMNAALVNNWNDVVATEDIVYVLGDMFWCKAGEAQHVLDQLNGRKILIRGNHDRNIDGHFEQKIEKIADYLEVEDGGCHIVLCHYPIPCFKNHFYGWYHLYGHVHNSFEYAMMEHDKYMMKEIYDRPCQMFNVGAMMPWMAYTPRTFDEIVTGAQHEQGADERQCAPYTSRTQN